MRVSAIPGAKDSKFVRGLLGTSPPDPPHKSASPPLLRGRFGIEIESNQEIDVESMPN